MKMKTKSLKSQFTFIITVSLISLLLLQSVIFIAYLLYNQRRLESYISGVLKSITSSINSQALSIEEVSYAITTNNDLASLYYNRSVPADPDKLVDIYQTSSRICQFNTDILDVVIVDTGGKSASFYSGYGEDYTIVNDLQSVYDFSSKDNDDRFFYFFPSNSHAKPNCFVYIAPIQISNQKVATALFVCSLDAIGSALNYQIGDVAYTFNVYDKEKKLVYSNAISQPSDHDNIKQMESTIPNIGLTICARIPSTFSGRNTIFVFLYYLFSSVIIAAMLIGFLFLVKRKITDPFNTLMGKMESIGQSNLTLRLGRTNIYEIDIIVGKINSMLDKIDVMTHKIFKTQNKLYESEIRKNTAELYALQSQINPHFFCNTMQCIRGIAVMKDDNEIASIALAMNNLFRYAIKSNELEEIQKEIQIIEEYLSIYIIRFNGRFKYDIDIEPSVLHCMVPKLLLQPIVENSIVHGVSRIEAGGKISISGRKLLGDIVLHITDNGPGIEKEKLKEIRQSIELTLYDQIVSHANKHLGLCNINRRIKLKYGNEYGVTITSSSQGTDVMVKVPFTA